LVPPCKRVTPPQHPTLIPPPEKSEAEAAFVGLIQSLANAGFATEVRAGNGTSLLVFLKIASDKLLRGQIYRYRLQDWLYGVRPSAPHKDLAQHMEEEPISEAERLRLAYMLITKPKNEGGAGITPKSGEWKHVKSIFPLHDYQFNREWIKSWGTKYMIDEDDLTDIRDRFGEKIAFYFAFLQAYFQFLLFPAAFGFGAWLILGQFSWFYAVVNCLWSVVFFEFWKKREVDLAVTWGVRGVGRIQLPRSQFQFEHEALDPVTGEIVKVYSPMKRLQRQMLQVPFALACVLVLGSLIVSCFAIEIFISEVYNGPFKQYLVCTLRFALRSAVSDWVTDVLGLPSHDPADSLHADPDDLPHQLGRATHALRELRDPRRQVKANSFTYRLLLTKTSSAPSGICPKDLRP
jgi:anoctamin-10